MFESDDFDQVLSQFDFPELSSKKKLDLPTENSTPNCKQGSDVPKTRQTQLKTYDYEQLKTNHELPSPDKNDIISINNVTFNKSPNDFPTPDVSSMKHSKRKLLNSHFDTKSKRKFPGPAGLLIGTLQESTDDSIGQLELLSQDVDFSENHMRRDIFETPLWLRLLDDMRTCGFGDVDSLKAIKQQALAGNLRKRKAQTIMAFVEAVDRSATDPLVILRDASGNIKSTLHRDAWLAFSPYIVSEYCAFILRKPTVLTTGSTYKKHYLNITLSNIYAIYSSAVMKDDVVKPMPEGYKKICEEEFTIIKTDCLPVNDSDGFNNIMDNTSTHSANDDELLEGLDGSIFMDDIF